MANEQVKTDKLHSLMALEDFKAILSIDDREDKIAKFCLVTSTLTIEQYCKRRLLRKKHFERIELNGDLLLPLKDYPVTKMLAVYTLGIGVKNPLPCGFLTSEFASQTPAKAISTPPSMAGEILEPEFYGIIPDCSLDNDIPFAISLSPALKLYNNFTAIKAVYYAGYPFGKIPADLSAACLELASWNLNRYRGKHIGMTGNTKTEHLELSIPENVKQLLEPYKRRTI
jgi:hypothetical protein